MRQLVLISLLGLSVASCSDGQRSRELLAPSLEVSNLLSTIEIDATALAANSFNIDFGGVFAGPNVVTTIEIDPGDYGIPRAQPVCRPFHHLRTPETTSLLGIAGQSLTFTTLSAQSLAAADANSPLRPSTSLR